jgi:4-hydroxy-3-polyprenylbenzoate decarboxylase
VFEEIARHFDPYEDFLLLPKVPFDTLDFTSYTLNVGSKMILDATPDALVDLPVPALPDLCAVDDRILGQALVDRAILAVQVTGDDPRGVLARVLEAIPGGGAGSDQGPLAPPKIVAAVSPDIPLDDPRLLLWGIFTRFDPARDAFFEESRLRGAWPLHRGRMAIDATFKAGYPAALEMDPDVVKLVDRRWSEYGID